MARSRSNFSRSPSGSRRLTQWNEGPHSVATQSVTGAGNTIWGIGQSGFSKLTIVRIRGEFVAWLEVVGSIGDGFTRLTMGIGIASTDAFTQGGPSLPSPVSDADWNGWIWHAELGPLVGLSVTESENTGPLSQVRVPIDTKAMRKLSPNETVFGAVATSAEIGVATMVFGANTRMLLKLA